ncbi:PAS domain S-box protein [Halomontanus rarus]|uniref:PAS domain S-box protein n=1 Tax=Halomontanus rarus TaxID=3034020 RepID=UPI0023E8C7CF|nr:PAS domain S-box protein [Halovivax sp. TS33]
MEPSAEADGELRSRIRQQAVVADLSQQALEFDDFDRLLRDAAVAVSEALDTEYSAVFERVPGRDGLVLRDGAGWHADLVETATVPSAPDSLTDYALDSDGPVIVDELGTEDRFSAPALLADHDVVSGVSVAVGPLEEPWGILGVYTTDRREFADADATFLRSVANVLANPIETAETNRQHETGAETEAETGTEAETDGECARELKLRRYETIVETVDDGIYAVDSDGRFVVVNEAFCEMTGYDREELLGSHATTVHADEITPRAERLTAEIAAGERDDATISLDLWTKSGETVPAESRLAPFSVGDESGRCGVVRDVTEHAERERELARFKRAVEASGHAIHMSNLDEEITYVNPAFCETTGYAAEEVIGESPRILESGEHDDAYYRALRETVRAGDVWEAEIVDQRKDGELYHAEQTIAPVTDEDGEIDRFVAVQNEITERKERERELEESEARFRLLAETLEEMVWISDTDTREILYVNAAYETIWGRDRESLYDDPRSFLEAVHPDDRRRVERAYAAVPDEDFDEEYRIVRPDGRTRWLHVRAVPARDGERQAQRVVGIAEDITERKERKRALEESERRYRTLVENFPNGAVGLFDEDLCYTAVGGELMNAAGVAPDDRVGNHVSEIYPNEMVAEIEPNFHAALAGEANSFEVDYHDRHLYAHTLPVRNADGKVFAGMLVVEDVTERREYQRRLEESNERLEQFAYAASHDLQEPLRMVTSYLQLIERRYGDALDDDGEEFLEYAVDGAERMRSMIEGLLEYSRVETRGDEFEPVELETVLEDVRETLRIKIDESDAEITSESLPRVEGDAGQLRQVFQNLLANAIDYSGAEPPRVHVAAERTGTEWTVSVTDEGIGIDSADQERVFEVFQRIHTDTTGTGIGLALCKRIVERHGGEIWVDSDPGEGATFSFTLPALELEAGGGR